MKKLLSIIAVLFTIAVLVNLNLSKEAEARNGCDLNMYTQGEKLCYICTIEDSNSACTSSCGTVICTVPDIE